MCFVIVPSLVMAGDINKMMNETIEEKVDKLLIPSRRTIVKPKQRSRTRKVFRWLTTPLSLIVIGGLIASGALLGMFTSFYSITSGDITLNGQTQVPLFFYDGIPFDGRWYNTTVDTTVLNAGDEFTATHILGCEDGGNWSVFWSNPCESFESDPLSQYYGFYYQIRNTLTGLPFESTPVIHPGEQLSFDSWYALDREFVPIAEPLSFECTMSILPVVLQGVDDDYPVVGGTHYEFTPWDNDIAFMTRNVVITSYDWAGAMHMNVEISENGRFLVVDTFEAGSLDGDLTLYLEDTLTGDTSSSHCLIHFI